MSNMRCLSDSKIANSHSQQHRSDCFFKSKINCVFLSRRFDAKPSEKTFLFLSQILCPYKDIITLKASICFSISVFSIYKGGNNVTCYVRCMCMASLFISLISTPALTALSIYETRFLQHKATCESSQVKNSLCRVW